MVGRVAVDGLAGFSNPILLYPKAENRPSYQASLGVWHWDVRAGRVVWSPENFRLHGLCEREAAPDFNGWLERIHPDDRERAAKAAEAALTSGHFKMVYRAAKPDGGWRWLLGEGTVERGPCGTPVRMVGSNLDLTEIRLFMEILLSKAERLGMLIGMDDPEPDSTQRLTREIHDALLLALREIS